MTAPPGAWMNFLCEMHRNERSWSGEMGKRDCIAVTASSGMDVTHMREAVPECCSGVDEPVSRLAGYASILPHSSFTHVVLTLGRCPLQRGSCHDSHHTTGGPMTSPFSCPPLRRLLLLLLFLLLLLLLLLGASGLDAPCAISTASPTAIPPRSR